MEPWQLEAARQLALDRKRRLTCDCCGEAVATDRFLLLRPFGVEGLACEKCVERHMRWSDLVDGEVGL